MNLQRALKIIPHDATITATCRPNHYGGAWVVRATLPDGYERIVTQFVDPALAARWVNGWYEKVPATDLTTRAIHGSIHS